MSKVLKIFWVTIIALAAIVLTASLLAYHNSSSVEPQTSTAVSSSGQQMLAYEIKPTTLEKIFSDVAVQTIEVFKPRVDGYLDQVYSPVYQHLDDYLDFHYSVLGEYVELGQAALGEMGGALETKVFEGFDVRMNKAWSLIDDDFGKSYKEQLLARINSSIPDADLKKPLGPITEHVINDTLARTKTTLPIAGGLAVTTGAVAMKAVFAGMAKKIAATIAAKTGAKVVVKSGGVLGGAGTGAAICSPGGPVGAAVCGVGGAIIAWLTVDAVVVKIDEYINRDEFKQELSKLIDEDRKKRRDEIYNALMTASTVMDEQVRTSVQNIRLKDQARPVKD